MFYMNPWDNCLVRNNRRRKSIYLYAVILFCFAFCGGFFCGRLKNEIFVENRLLHGINWNIYLFSTKRWRNVIIFSKITWFKTYITPQLNRLLQWTKYDFLYCIHVIINSVADSTKILNEKYWKSTN